MPGKKVSFGRKPGALEKPVDVEEWVTNREALTEVEPTLPPVESAKPEKINRLTLDNPESLQKAIKLISNDSPRNCLTSGIRSPARSLISLRSCTG